jgi:alkanesulfonate monooxygenase SsuD/methylene tetrahydromethanopterin reductase-like flavin-dependent oxidoreductase (luciferase family)
LLLAKELATLDLLSAGRLVVLPTVSWSRDEYGGPPLWFGGSAMHSRLLRRLVRYGQGFNPLGRPPRR